MSNNRILKIMLLSTVFLFMLVCLSVARTDHREYKDSKLTECNECHGASGVMSNHGAFFVKEHRLLAQKAGNNCADCHQQSFCIDCHQGGGITTDLQRSPSRQGEYMPKTHGGDFISTHPIKAADNPQNCYRCHQSSFCTDCHGKIRQKGSMNIKSHRKAGPSQIFNWNSDHAVEVRRNLQSCEACHPDADVCVQCHSTGKVNPHPRNWRDISKQYRDESKGRTCRKCHITY